MTTSARLADFCKFFSRPLSGRIPQFWIVPMGEFKLVLCFLRKPSAAPVHAGLVEATETSFEPEMAHRRASE